MEELLITGVRFLGALPMFVAAACLVFFNRGKLQSVVYDRSRLFITAATLLLGVHFAIQFVGQLREQSVTLCWTLNMMAYVIATPLYNMAELNLRIKGLVHVPPFRLNFPTQSAFGKFFKQKTGYSPSEYRKMHFTK